MNFVVDKAPLIVRKALLSCFVLLLISILFSVHPFRGAKSPVRAIALPLVREKSVSERRLYQNVPRKLLSGVASWYGDVFDGHSTASGEIFRRTAMTACHPTLPFGTLVRVINLRNRRSVVVRINDRGVRPDRIIDLSSAAAERIGLLDTGIAPVRIIILDRSKS